MARIWASLSYGFERDAVPKLNVFVCKGPIHQVGTVLLNSIISRWWQFDYRISRLLEASTIHFQKLSTSSHSSAAVTCPLFLYGNSSRNSLQDCKFRLCQVRLGVRRMNLHNWSKFLLKMMLVGAALPSTRLYIFSKFIFHWKLCRSFFNFRFSLKNYFLIIRIANTCL